jgi:hypothetical protein
VDLDNTNSNDSLGAALAFFNNASLQDASTPMHHQTDHFLDSVLENSNSSMLQTPPRVRPTPPTSPSRAVSNDSWLPDLSMSSFLANFNSSGGGHSNNTTPIKVNRSTNAGSGSSKVVAFNDDSVQSTGSEVDRQLLSMMTETSVDFTFKFAKLASAVVGSGSDMQNEESRG